MKQLVSALQFLTSIPLKRSVDFRPTVMLSYFPIVGLLVGCAVLFLDFLTSMLWSFATVSLLDVIFLAILSGALHLDGLGDTADGLFSHRSRREKLSIMKDSRVGIMGVVAIFSVLFLKWAGIQEVTVCRGLVLILVPAYSRTAMMFAIKFLPYGRPEGGTGQDFFSQKIPFSSFWGFFILIFLSFFLGWQAVWFNIVFVAVTTLVLWSYHNSLKCVTGDNLGALNEVLEAVLFLTAAAG